MTSRLTGARRGQSTVEFALISIVLIGLILAVIDLSRAGFMQHDLDSGAGDLARSLAALSGTNASGDGNAGYSPTPLTPANTQAALAHAAQIANYDFTTTPPLTYTGAMTLSNGQVTVVGTPDLTSTMQLTVTITAPFTPVVGLYLNHSLLNLQASSSVLTPQGQLST